MPLRSTPLPMAEEIFLKLTETMEPCTNPSGVDAILNPSVHGPSESFVAYSVTLNHIIPKIDQAHARSISDNFLGIESIQAVDEASKCLDSWGASLSVTMVNTPQNLTHWTKHGLGNMFVILHMNYYHLRHLLFYQFLHGSTEQECHSSLISQYAQRCRQYATQLCDLIHLAGETPGAEVLNSFVGHVLTISSTVQLHILLFSKDDEEIYNARRILERNFKLLMRLKVYWPCVDLSFSRFEAFHQACLRTQDETQFRPDHWMIRFMVEFAAPLAERDSGEAIECTIQRPWNQIRRASYDL